MINKRLTLVFKALGLFVVFNLLFIIFGSQTIQARSCGVDTKNVHDYAGLMVNMRWQHNGGGAYFESNNTKVRLNTIGDVSTPPGGIVYVSGGAEQDRKDSSTFQQKDFPGCEYNSSGDNHMVMLGYDGSSRRDVAGDGRADSWMIDCDSSIRDPDDNDTHPGWDSKYQKFRVSAVGVPTGAIPGGKWHAVGSANPFEDVAPANGFTKKVTLVYEEPYVPPNNPACTYYSHPVYANSAHRFTVFGRGATVSPTSPTDGGIHTTRDLSADGVANISWASPLPGYVWQSSVINPWSDYTWDKTLGSGDTPPVDSGWQILYERWYEYRNAANKVRYQYFREVTTVDDCYKADIDEPGAGCSSLHIEGDRPPGGNANSVKAGTNFTVSGGVKNTGNMNIPITVKVIDGGGMAGSQDDVGSLGPGLPAPFDIPMTSINDVSHRIVTVQPQYNGFAIGGDCSIEVDTFQQFNITPIATLDTAQNDNENPTTIHFNYGGTRQFGPDTTSAGSYTVAEANPTLGDPTILVAGDTTSPIDGPNGTNLTYQNQNIAGSYTNANIRATLSPGERYCIITKITEAFGWLGPHGKVGTGPSSKDSCARVVNKPYVRFYGQDVFAGGNFPDRASVTGAISTNNRARAGSGVEYAAFALGAIGGFSSSDLRSDGFFDQLNFASSPKGNFGGSHTATDYFANKPDNATGIASTATPSGTPVPVTTPPTEGINSYIAGNLTLNANTSFSGKQTIFVSGDVYISGNIVYAPWGPNINAIPSFRLIVKGNIYIDKDVTQIDGFLVAQPNGATGGTISTCSNSSGANGSLTTTGDRTPTNGECSRQLVFNGALVAQKIKWLRTFKTLSDAKLSGLEPYDNNSSAEIVNTSPDFYLGIPADPPSGGGTSGKYDSYQALPPIL